MKISKLLKIIITKEETTRNLSNAIKGDICYGLYSKNIPVNILFKKLSNSANLSGN